MSSFRNGRNRFEVRPHLGRRTRRRHTPDPLQGSLAPAAPVQNGRDLFEDPQLRHRGWFARLSHPEAGTHEYAGLPHETAGQILQPTSAAPLLGQHTATVLKEAD
ncbi:CoA transferase [Streptomyces sp. DT203]|uniref:CoA transferase n=1 Tax=Streptomyces sp. DT203 TaxID=3393424 RepID=UPI003CEBE7D4